MKGFKIHYQPGHTAFTIVLIGVIAALFMIDHMLAKVEKTEVEREAGEQFESGMRLLHAGNSGRAVELLQRAHTLARDRSDYSLGLSEALTAAGMRAEAETRLRDLLKDNSNDGRANLLLARILWSDSSTNEAIVYYRRAIYGTWTGNANAEATKVRLELAHRLAKIHRQQELLSELLLLQEAAQNNLPMEREVAALFLAAGSGSRAEQMYKGILHRVPGETEAYQGLGEAYLLTGDFRSAESTFSLALKNRRGDEELLGRVKFATRLAQMDPTSRRLSSAEKFQRATQLLDEVRAELATCPAASSPLGSEPSTSQPPVKDSALAGDKTVPITNEFAEARLASAEQLWQVRVKNCGRPPTADDATAIIMNKLNQTQ